MLFWTILFVFILAGLAYSWIVVRTSSERVTISLELLKIGLAVRKAREAALCALHGQSIQSRDPHSHTG